MAFDSTALKTAGVSAKDQVAEAVSTRTNIFQMTQAAEDAVLRPKSSGSWSHALRAGLAGRIAVLNNETELADLYLKDAGEHAALADPGFECPDQKLAEVVRFMDKVAANTRGVRDSDVKALQEISIADDDIVRLAELNAFLAYQIRLVAGLRLMKGSAE